MTVTNAELLTLARQLPIPVPWDRDVFVSNLAQARGRPIRLVPTSTAALTDSPCGLWVTLDHEDLILHETGTSQYHIDQIVCHEVGHMVLGHSRCRKFGDDKARQAQLCLALLPDINPATVRAVLGRTNYPNDEERDAEMFANMLMVAAAEAAADDSMLRSVFFWPK
ncbi:hypothetical protein OQ968_02740 [Mycobacterium sp. 663a-19]|uniref:hypothetical protein n=1 Tax=Mycobacterium sp. 663a-19 TaxID=2986148 RepID=UPI002D1F28A2|nr:hypothetical protein [Mycobacterium sp. 663a-19]MEB3980177.1 hypothetical protein [Mycobacterium sp. 663a-19]